MFFFASLFVNAQIKTLIGRFIAKVNFVAIDPAQGKMIGLIFQKGFFQKSVFVVLAKDILEAGGGVVVVKNEVTIEPIEEIIRAEKIWQEKLNFFGMPAVTESDQKLGYVHNMLLDREGFYIHRFYIKAPDGGERILSRELAIGVKDRKLIFKDESLNRPYLRGDLKPQLRPSPVAV